MMILKGHMVMRLTEQIVLFISNMANPVSIQFGTIPYFKLVKVEYMEYFNDSTFFNVYLYNIPHVWYLVQILDHPYTIQVVLPFQQLCMPIDRFE